MMQRSLGLEGWTGRVSLKYSGTAFNEGSEQRNKVLLIWGTGVRNLHCATLSAFV